MEKISESKETLYIGIALALLSTVFAYKILLPEAINQSVNTMFIYVTILFVLLAFVSILAITMYELKRKSLAQEFSAKQLVYILAIAMIINILALIVNLIASLSVSYSAGKNIAVVLLYASIILAVVYVIYLLIVTGKTFKQPKRRVIKSNIR
jgi:cbb3-type cytochrome oxidase subunit 1